MDVKKQPAKPKYQQQLNLPVLLDLRGIPLTLKQYLDLLVSDKDQVKKLEVHLKSSFEFKKKLVLARIEQKTKFNVRISCIGAIGKARALREIKAETDIGKILCNSELITIRLIKQLSQKKQKQEAIKSSL